MARKGRTERQLAKQLKQIQKLEKRLKQKGISVEPTASTQSSPSTIQSVKEHKKQLEQQLKGTPVKVEIPSIVEQVKTKFKLTQKQIKEAIQARKLRAPKPVPKKETKEPEKKPTPRKKLKLTQKQLEKAIQGRKPVQPKKAKPVKPKVAEPQQEQTTGSMYTPPPEAEREDNVNSDTSFYSLAVIANFRAQIHMYPSYAEPLLSHWLDQLIEKHGMDDVAQMLQDGANAGVVLTWEIAYSADKLVGYMAELLDFLPEMTDWYKAEIMEQFENWEDII